MVAKMIAKGELDMDEAIANQPIARLGTADEMAAAVLRLCTPGWSFVLGVALPVDGGSPHAKDRRYHRTEIPDTRLSRAFSAPHQSLPMRGSARLASDRFSS
jgi:Enoyl-(Acyl carrier protein) reductase